VTTIIDANREIFDFLTFADLFNPIGSNRIFELSQCFWRIDFRGSSPSGIDNTKSVYVRKSGNWLLLEMGNFAEVPQTGIALSHQSWTRPPLVLRHGQPDQHPQPGTTSQQPQQPQRTAPSSCSSPPQHRLSVRTVQCPGLCPPPLAINLHE
jgi:hypothetical protein